MIIGVARFGYDHWHLLWIIGTLAEGKGQDAVPIPKYHLRCNREVHGDFATKETHAEWSPEYGTELKGGEKLQDHDSWDCLADFQASGFLEIVEERYPIVKLLGKGKTAYQQMKEFRQRTGTLRGFSF
jgi:hypothetical protein